jgi:DNA-binding transcriptional LysR family regulator
MRLSLDALLVLDAIDRKGSFATAADELHRVPSAITYAVQKLEQDLDVVLFNRSGHRAQLTPAGRELLDSGRHLLRAAEELECRVKRVATGWETELRIAASDLIPFTRVQCVVAEFFEGGHGTQIRILREVLGGTWDALVAGRADLAVGADASMPSGGGYTIRPLGIVDFVYAIAPDHPLAHVAEPIPAAEIMKYRSVSAADSSRNLPPASVGILSGQQVFTVPDLAAKLDAQCTGLGVGYLPCHLAAPAIDAGRLVIREVEEPKPATQLFLAWHTKNKGKALQWFARRLLTERDWLDGIVASA